MPTFRTNSFAKTNTSLPEVEQQVAAESARPAKTNKYAADCASCKGRVPAGEGSLSSVDGRWVVRHHPACPDPTLTIGAAPTDLPVREARQTVIDGRVLFDGTYTWETEDGHQTFRLRTQGLDADFMPGVQVVQRLVGADNDSDYQSFGHVKDDRLRVWKKHQGTRYATDAEDFFAEPHEALHSTACYRCGRTLTVPASVHNGLGPECARKGL